MTVESDLVAKLKANSGISTAVGGTRIHALILPQQESWPGDSITYEVPSIESLRNLSGPTGRDRPRFRIHCWSQSYGNSLALANLVRGHLDGFAGVMGATQVGQIRFESATDLPEDQPRFPGAPILYRRTLDFFVSHVA